MDFGQMASIVVFPLARRRALVIRLANQMLSRSPDEAEQHLAFELRRHRQVLACKQLLASAIEMQLRALEQAVRAEIWRAVLIPDGRA